MAQPAERAPPDYEPEIDDDGAGGLGQRGNAEAPPVTVAAAAAVAISAITTQSAQSLNNDEKMVSPVPSTGMLA